MLWSSEEEVVDDKISIRCWISLTRDFTSPRVFDADFGDIFFFDILFDSLMEANEETGVLSSSELMTDPGNILSQVSLIEHRKIFALLLWLSGVNKNPPSTCVYSPTIWRAPVTLKASC